MKSNNVLRKPIQLLITAAIAVVMVGAFVVVDSVGPGGDDQVAFAKPGSGGNSGKSTVTKAKTTKAKTTKTKATTRPGLGCGDKNHQHTGAPGNPGKTCKTKTTSTTTGTTTTGTTTDTTTATTTIGTTTLTTTETTTGTTTATTTTS